MGGLLHALSQVKLVENFQPEKPLGNILTEPLSDSFMGAACALIVSGPMPPFKRQARSKSTYRHYGILTFGPLLSGLPCGRQRAINLILQEIKTAVKPNVMQSVVLDDAQIN